MSLNSAGGKNHLILWVKFKQILHILDNFACGSRADIFWQPWKSAGAATRCDAVDCKATTAVVTLTSHRRRSKASQQRLSNITTHTETQWLEASTVASVVPFTSRSCDAGVMHACVAAVRACENAGMH